MELDPAKALRLRAESTVRMRPYPRCELAEHDLNRVLHELEIHQVELEMQNEELRSTQLALADHRDRYFRLYDLAPVGYLTLDRAGRIAEANLAAAALLGVDRAELQGRYFASFFEEAQADILHVHLQDTLASQAKHACDLLLNDGGANSGGATAIRMESVAFVEPNSHATWCQSALIDQSVRARAPQVRRNSSSSPEAAAQSDAGTSCQDILIGTSRVMVELKHLLQRVAKVPSTVLLTGESGVGKDAAARYLHASSPRANKPFINVTCSAIPETLLESELFGHERGAFTDAKTRKLGLLELAHDGTVLLDEIGEISAVLQAKLLRFLEEKTFRRVGGSEDLSPNVRVIAATNRDLREEVRAGTFREDLYYRLAVLVVQVPPLRDREDDVVLLARGFLQRYAMEFGKRGIKLTPEAEALLNKHTWPGNVRELKNTMERAALMADGPDIDASNLIVEGFAPMAERIPTRSLELPDQGIKFDELEQELLAQALERTRGNRTRAATLLGLTRDQLRYRIEKYGLTEVSLVNKD